MKRWLQRWLGVEELAVHVALQQAVIKELVNALKQASEQPQDDEETRH